MTETASIRPIPPEERLELLLEQVWLFHGYALGLARASGLSPEEAADRFFEGIAAGRASRTTDVEEIGRIAVSLASFLEMLYGNVVVRTDGDTWSVQTRLNEKVKHFLAKWDIPIEFFGRWVAEVQRREGELLHIRWRTQVDGDMVRQELDPAPCA